jgi:glyoxylase-like metal-dependent hydrolase (beta-lactamase superfamily II)
MRTLKSIASVIFLTVLRLDGSAAVAAEPEVTINPPPPSAPMTDHDLGNGVHVLQSFGGNIGVLVGKREVLIVDAEYPQLTPKVRAAVGKLSPLPIRYVVNTHWHWDHMGANAEFARSGATIISSEETRQHIADALADEVAHPAGTLQQTNSTQIVIGLGAKLHLVTSPYSLEPDSLPQLTLRTGAQLHLAEESVEIFHVAPAHTDGDLVVRFPKANVIQTGDTFFRGVYPYIDVAHGGSIDGMIAWYDKLYELCDANTKIIPGHGEVANRDDVRTYQAMLRDLRNRVAKGIAAGQSKEDLIATHPLDDLDKTWGGDVIKQPFILSLVYESLMSVPKK